MHAIYDVLILFRSIFIDNVSYGVPKGEDVIPKNIVMIELNCTLKNDRYRSCFLIDLYCTLVMLYVYYIGMNCIEKKTASVLPKDLQSSP